MTQKTIIVNGMSCNHCKNSVEKTIGVLPFIDVAKVDLERQQLYVEGQNIDLEVIKKEVESLGFVYGGEVAHD